MRDKMTKEEFRQYILSAEGKELPKLMSSPMSAGPSAYDLAGRKVACALLRFFERHSEINPQDTHYLAKDQGTTQINDVVDEQANKEIDAVGPTGEMFGWALGRVKWLLKKE